MVPSDDDSQTENDLSSRAPILDDLIRVCRWLNERNSKYIVIGGMAYDQAKSGIEWQDIPFKE